MKQFNPRQSIELFHLFFLYQLGRKVDKKLYVLKGGCNMRFYFRSIRYSEDMDIDIHTINKDTLAKNINQILKSSSFQYILQTNNIEIITTSTPKQTQTTQRWKITLKSKNIALPINTKIEFSRRELVDDAVYEAIDPLIIRHYSLTPFMVNHYSAQSMFRQKIRALALRNETQSRDIFDLYLLIGSGIHFKLDKKTISMLADAKLKAEAITFEDFKGQVIAYLPEDYQQQYDDKSVWNSMVRMVITSLDERKHEIN